jgi:hypothetical protein
MSGRNFKRMPVKFGSVPQLDDELDNVYKQLNLFTGETVRHDDSKDLFEIPEYNKVLKIDRATATVPELYDLVATLIVKLKDLNAINVKVKGL